MLFQHARYVCRTLTPTADGVTQLLRAPADQVVHWIGTNNALQ